MKCNELTEPQLRQICKSRQIPIPRDPTQLAKRCCPEGGEWLQAEGDCLVRGKAVRLRNGETVQVDYGIADLVQELNDSGFETFTSHSGLRSDHTCPRSKPFLGFRVPFKYDPSELSGRNRLFPYTTMEPDGLRYALCLWNALIFSEFKPANFGYGDAESVWVTGYMKNGLPDNEIQTHFTELKPELESANKSGCWRLLPKNVRMRR